MNEATLPFHPRHDDQLARRTTHVRDGRPHIPYQYSDEIVLAVNAARATHRPLLLRGAPGSGKSTLARDIAIALDAAFEEHVITSHSRATDLLWTFDAVRRLGDAQIRASDHAQAHPLNDASYVTPGVLWKAFATSVGSSVVLIDEIDKADPDVPNDLLVPLGESRFTITDGPARPPILRQRDVLVVITTNGERELPAAFLRRCVAITLDDPSTDPARLDAIVQAHLAATYRGRPAPPVFDPALVRAIVQRLDQLAASPGTRRAGTAEILDAYHACVELGIGATADEWKLLTRVLLFKEPGNPDAPQVAG